MITRHASARICCRLDWISALRNAELLFKDQKDSEIDTKLCAGECNPQVAEIVSAEFPGERLLVCLNPRLRQERAKREQLLRATETILTEMATARRYKSNSATATAPLSGSDAKPTAAKSKSTSTSPSPSDLLWSRNQQRIVRCSTRRHHVIQNSLSADFPRPSQWQLQKSVHSRCAPFAPCKTTRGGAAQCLQRSACTRTCVPVHAHLLPGMATPATQTVSV